VVLGTDSEIPLYLLKVWARDLEFDVRDRARLLVGLLTAQSERLQEAAPQILNPDRTPAKWTELESERQFAIGTLSQFFGREVAGYEALPDWANEAEIPPDSVRMPAQKAVPKKQGSRNPEEEDSEEEGEVDISEFFDTEKDAVEAVGRGEEAEEDPGEEEVDGEGEEDIDGFFD
jgi:hypothetical protein